MQNCRHYSYYKEVSNVQEYTSLVMEYINNVVGIKLGMCVGIDYRCFIVDCCAYFVMHN